MKPNELRIGNYVQNAGCRAKKVTKSLMIAILDETIRFAEPIPLTEEWLLKFGVIKTDAFDFENKATYHFNPVYQTGKKKDRHDIVGSDLSICVYEANYHILLNVCDDNCFVTEGIKIESVHQLQNLYFALTGKELNIVMP